MKRLHILIILVVAFLLVLWFLVWPAIQNISLLRQEQKDWQAKLQEALDAKQRLTELQKTYQKLQDDVSRITDAIPGKEDLPGLLVQFETMSSQNGLILSSLNFAYPAPEKVASAPVVETEDQTGSNKSVTAVPIIPAAQTADQVVPSNVKILTAGLELTGDYTALKNFLKAIENNLRLSDVASIAFTQQESVSSSGQSFAAGKLTISLNVYYKN